MVGKLKETPTREHAMLRTTTAAFVLLLIASTLAQAGLYYSGEKYASLPSQWRGFLLDHRALRNIAVKPRVDSEASPLRQRYLQEAKALQARMDKDKLGADDSADLGALYIPLGHAHRAVQL